MKKTFQILVAVFLIVSLLPCYVAADSQTKEVQDMVDALPLLSSVDADNYQQVFTQTKQTVYALANLPDWQMEEIKDYQKAIQLYIDLIVMKVESLLPTEVTTQENYLEQTVALETVNDILFEQEPLFVLAEYTYDTVNPIFYPPETTTGFVALYNVQLLYHEACQRRVDYLSNFYEAQRFALKELEYTLALENFPETFTQENVLTYANDFVMLIHEVENWDGKYYYLNEFSPENGERYDTLRQDFEVAMGIYSDYFMEQIDREILTLCGNGRAASLSYLRLQVIERPLYEQLAGQIEALAFINGVRVYNGIENLALFEAYEQNFFPETFPFGDLDGDYLVNASDALRILRVAVGKEQVNQARFTVGDVDGSGELNAKDALLVLQFAVNMIDWFPVEMELYGIVE